MPHNKNQHFVPRAYLKRFADPANRKAISLYNFRSGIFIPAAPLRGQCASSYLYGEDLQLERLLADQEGEFARVSAGMIADPIANIPQEDLEELRLFLVVQMFRTEQAVAKMRDQLLSIHQLMFHDIEEAPDLGDLSDKGLILRSIKLGLDFYKALTDLRFAIVRNATGTPFITSDAPAVATNRLFLQRYKMDNFGLGQSGMILFLSIDPETAILFYDRDVYTLRDSVGHLIEINNDRDAISLNRIVALEAKQNIYFRGNEALVSRFIEDTRSNFVPRWHTQGVYAPDPTADDKSSYQRVPDDHRQAGSMLYVSSVHYPDPVTWLSRLAFRRQMVGYTNGSAVGYVRRHTAAMDGVAVWKVDLGTAPRPVTPSRGDHLAWREGRGSS